MPSGVAVIGASGLAGLAVFGYFAVLDRFLGPAAQDRFAAFYSLSLLLGFGAFLPVEAELARTLGQRRDRADGMREGALVAAGVTVVVVAAVLLASSVVLDQLGGSGWLLAATVAVTAVSALQFWVRGSLLGQGRPRAFAGTLALDSVLRLLVAGVLVVVVADPSAALFSLSLLLPLLVGHGVFLPLVLRGSRRLGGASPGQAPGEDPGTDPGTDPGERTPDGGVHPLRTARRLLPLFAATISTQVLLNAPVLLIGATSQGAQAAGFLYAFSLARVPLFMAVPVQGAVVPPIAAMVADGRIHQVVRLLARVAAGLLALAVVGGAGFALVGPAVLGVLYPNSFPGTGVPVRLDLALMVVGVAANIGLLLTAQANVAAGHHRGSGIAWVCALVLGALTYLVAGWLGAGPYLRVESAFALGSALGWVLALVLLLRHARSHHPPATRAAQTSQTAQTVPTAPTSPTPKDDA